MRRHAALAVCLGLAFSACTKDEPRMPSACTDTDRAAYERALTVAPRAVQLRGGVTISQCARRVRTDAELQNLGAVLHAVAEDLAGRARAGDAAAARSLGYLSAAVGAGASQSGGIAAELARRIETTGAGLTGAGVAQALRTGIAAGQAHG